MVVDNLPVLARCRVPGSLPVMKPYWKFDCYDSKDSCALHAWFPDVNDVNGNRATVQEILRLHMQCVDTTIADGILVEVIPGNMFKDMQFVAVIYDDGDVRIDAENVPEFWAELAKYERMRLKFMSYSAQTTPTGQGMH